MQTYVSQSGEVYSTDDIEQMRITPDFKVQCRIEGGTDWITLAEYDSAEELDKVREIYRVKEGFQPRFKFPERGFYEEYRTSANNSKE